METSRRNFLALAGLAPLAALGAATARAAEPAACYDMATMSLSEKASRRGLNFKDASDDPKKRCGLCAFFMAPKGNCGSCQLMNGAPVSTSSVCDNFAPKPA